MTDVEDLSRVSIEAPVLGSHNSTLSSKVAAIQANPVPWEVSGPSPSFTWRAEAHPEASTGLPKGLSDYTFARMKKSLWLRELWCVVPVAYLPICPFAYCPAFVATF